VAGFPEDYPELVFCFIDLELAKVCVFECVGWRKQYPEFQSLGDLFLQYAECARKGFGSYHDTFVYQDADLLSDVYTLPQFLLYRDGQRVATFSLPQKRPARAVSQAIKAHLFGQHDARVAQ